MQKHLLLLLILFQTITAYSQEKNYQISIKKSKEPIVLDGLLTESSWLSAQQVGNFFLNRPYDSTFASLQTTVRMTFDEHFVYVGVELIQPRKDYIISSLKRDFESGTSDVFSVYFDTFKDKLNGFQFSVNPYNVQREGLISFGSNTDYTWDNKWYSEVKNYDDKWVIELAVPFKTLRYKVTEGQNSWRINFGRFSMKTNEVSTWTPVPRNFNPSNLAFTGELIWEDTPPVPGANVSLIPYISGGRTADFPRNSEDLTALPTAKETLKGVGLDAKVAVTPSLNLDLTVNPDFSQVEVDKQQTNLSRFELYFPERRQFFIENSDLFGTFGFPDTRPFFSRRIGITRNPNTGLTAHVPILAGARLSGKLNKKWRVGAMNMQTRKVDFGNDQVQPAANYSVLTLQRTVFSRSTLGAIYVDKENIFTNLSETQQANFNKFNRVAGLEFNYYSPNNRFETESYYHQSFLPIQKKDAASFAHYMGYHHPNIDLNLAVMRIGENYQAETGYVPRKGIYKVYRPAKVMLYPKNEKISKVINVYGIGSEGYDVFDLMGSRLDSETPLFFFINSPGGAEVYIGYFWGFTHLFNPFDPTNAADSPDPSFSKDVVPLPVGDYRYSAPFIGIATSPKYKFRIKSDFWTGDYFNGKGTSLQSSVSYRMQPYGTFTVDVNYNDLQFPSPYKSATYWLIGPRAELAFSRSLFFSSFFQYNTQTNNTNINTRLQWRFKPVSDLFIVYTNNYFASTIPNYRIDAWTPKDRALIVKLTYWLNM